jgi:hypothetical protein
MPTRVANSMIVARLISHPTVRHMAQNEPSFAQSDSEGKGRQVV